MIVDKFLCCLKLEFCALFFGWFGVIATSVFMVVVTIVGAMTLLDFEDMRELLIRKAEDFDLGFGVDIVSYILTSRWSKFVGFVIVGLIWMYLHWWSNNAPSISKEISSSLNKFFQKCSWKTLLQSVAEWIIVSRDWLMPCRDCTKKN